MTVADIALPEPIPSECIALTVGLQRFLTQQGAAPKQPLDGRELSAMQVLEIPSRLVCRLHLSHRCRYVEDCNNVHICREYELALNPTSQLLPTLLGLSQATTIVLINDAPFSVSMLAEGDVADEFFNAVCDAQQKVVAQQPFAFLNHVNSGVATPVMVSSPPPPPPPVPPSYGSIARESETRISAAAIPGGAACSSASAGSFTVCAAEFVYESPGGTPVRYTASSTIVSGTSPYGTPTVAAAHVSGASPPMTPVVLPAEAFSNSSFMGSGLASALGVVPVPPPPPPPPQQSGASTSIHRPPPAYATPEARSGGCGVLHIGMHSELLLPPSAMTPPAAWATAPPPPPPMTASSGASVKPMLLRTSVLRVYDVRHAPPHCPSYTRQQHAFCAISPERASSSGQSSVSSGSASRDTSISA